MYQRDTLSSELGVVITSESLGGIFRSETEDTTTKYRDGESFF